MSASIRDGVLQGAAAELTQAALSTPQGQAAIAFAANTAIQTGTTAVAAVSALAAVALPLAGAAAIVVGIFALFEDL
jgi:hypothetical protein